MPDNCNDPFADPRFWAGVECFNKGDWYSAHDLFEELWHDTNEPQRRWLQAVVQISVALLHHQRGNSNGAMILLGEGLGRLRTAQAEPMDWQSQLLLCPCKELLLQLQRGGPSEEWVTMPQLSFQA